MDYYAKTYPSHDGDQLRQILPEVFIFFDGYMQKEKIGECDLHNLYIKQVDSLVI